MSICGTNTVLLRPPMPPSHSLHTSWCIAEARYAQNKRLTESNSVTIQLLDWYFFNNRILDSKEVKENANTSSIFSGRLCAGNKLHHVPHRGPFNATLRLGAPGPLGEGCWQVGGPINKQSWDWVIEICQPTHATEKKSHGWGTGLLRWN